MSRPKVVITDETLRDGLQIERLGVTLDEKLKLIDMLVAAGVNRLVVGAFVNPKWSPQMADTEQLVRRLKPRDGVQYFALALNDRGREIRQQFSPPLSVDPMPTTHLHLCEVFLLRNTNRRMEDQERTWRAPIEAARAAGAREAAMGLSAGMGLELARRVPAGAPYRRAGPPVAGVERGRHSCGAGRYGRSDGVEHARPRRRGFACHQDALSHGAGVSFASSQCPRHGDAVGL